MTFERKTLRIFYKKLLGLYPQAFREQFGESMEQTFDDVCREKIRQTNRLSFGFALWLFAETFLGAAKENLTQIKRGEIMENVASNSKSSAIISFLLAMPFAMMILIETFHIEPLRAFFVALTTETDSPRLSFIGMIIMFGTLLLLPIGFLVSFVPIARNIRAGNPAMTNPFTLFIAAALFIAIVTLLVGFVVDQYPCWIGVPNCD